MRMAGRNLFLLITLFFTFCGALYAEERQAEARQIEDHKTTFPVTFELQQSAYKGRASLTHSQGEHGETITRLTGKLSKPLPSGFSMPEMEEIQESGGMVLTRTLPALVEGDKESLIRISEYGTFLDLQALAVDIAKGRTLYTDLPDKEYRSEFVLLNKPSSVMQIKQEKHSDGSRLTLLMSDQSRLVFNLDNQFVIASLGVRR